MYRLTLPPRPIRGLCVAAGELGLAAAIGFASPGKHHPADWLVGAGVADGHWDAVALPQAWPRANGALAPTFFRRAYEALKPGGIVVGHCEHAWALRLLASSGGLKRAIQSPVASPAACRRALGAAGFVDVECYYIQPDMNDPMGLIPDDRAAARAQFLRAVRAEQGHFSAPAYAARVLLAQLGLGGLQQAQMFFWARKPC